MARDDLWTRDQLIVVFNLYLKLPFGKLDKRTPEVKELAALIDRTDNAVAMRLNNFAHVDPYHQQRGIIGLANGKKQVEPIWNEFVNNKEELTFESERILANYQHKTVEEKYPEIVFDLKDLKGEVKIRAVKTRVNQNVFRQMILKTYSNRCAISGINISELLVAGHIVPWAANEQERLNPENGLCLSNLYDRAYEKGLICIDTDFKVLLSKRLQAQSSKEFYEQFFGRFEHQSIQVPKTYQPKKEFLEYRLGLFDH
ncbi:HNH endonuclease [Larkinella punicea]|uniref:HNH endonuclease n=1 Tax=Larkinella punicea TaxID=2315727 RepID=A0A368JGK5_9BACT|nr:HNH endonuclease signature motif containing protein [Larkinella punicea]RCR66799.1 HNH endonuclease [Larkinella punicea]